MELQPAEQGGQITIDLSSVDVTEGNQSGLKYLFRVGLLSFGDELQDTVAASGGVDFEGKLDMEAYAAAKQAEAYLEGFAGQPVILTHEIYKPDGSFSRLDALVGVLPDEGKLIGMHDTRYTAKDPGIRVASGYAEVGVYSFSDGTVRQDRVVNVDEAVMPFNSSMVRLGHPEMRYDGDRTFKMSLIAGKDIMEWLHDTFPDDQAGYEIFCSVAKAMPDARSLRLLVEQPYVSMYRDELGLMDDLTRTLTGSMQRLHQLEREMAEERAAASVALSAIRERAGALTSRLPYTTSSDHNSVTANVGSIKDLNSRIHAVETHRQRLVDLMQGHTIMELFLDRRER